MAKRSSLQANANRKLTYGDQLKFKAAWRRHHKKGDIFYFDFVTGVDAKTAMDIPGLAADGSMTWSQADKILCKHFKIAV